MPLKKDKFICILSIMEKPIDLKDINEEDIALDSENDDSDDKMHEHFSYTVDGGQSPMRVDKYLTQKMERKSRSKIQNAAKAGCILVNNKPVKSNYKVKPGQTVSLVLPKPLQVYHMVAENIPLDIVYEDEDVIVLNKQVGLVVHPGVGNYTGTLVHGLLYHLQNLPVNKGSVDGEQRPGLVHRLDKNTSGLMVVAKNEYAMTHLAKQFFDRTVTRRYVALAWGDIDEDGTIEGHIGRNLRYRKVMDVFPDGDWGKHAVTHYKVLEKFGYTTLVECRLETGRTHQIRVHFKHINHPLFSDTEYGGDKIVKGTVYTKYKQFVQNCFKLLPRQALHAKILGFTHPATKKEMYFESELPEDMSAAIDKWRRYMVR